MPLFNVFCPVYTLLLDLFALFYWRKNSLFCNFLKLKFFKRKSHHINLHNTPIENDIYLILNYNLILFIRYDFVYCSNHSRISNLSVRTQEKLVWCIISQLILFRNIWDVQYFLNRSRNELALFIFQLISLLTDLTIKTTNVWLTVRDVKQAMSLIETGAFRTLLAFPSIEFVATLWWDDGYKGE